VVSHQKELTGKRRAARKNGAPAARTPRKIKGPPGATHGKSYGN
jgi:hypothetical protein